MAARKKAAKISKPQSDNPQLDLIRDLAAILNQTGLTEIELDHQGAKVRVSKTVHVTAAAHVAPPLATGHAPIPAAAAPVAVPAANDLTNAVKSPMVGTAYLAPAPTSPNFVSVGATVKEGQTVLIIEAMKTMNQIPAPRSGTVTRILVETGQPVEYGEALLVIE
jgi:acetyl-CoA carboxylase biotin carboxyl carrier protein